jgi:hypothetical protein
MCQKRNISFQCKHWNRGHIRTLRLICEFNRMPLQPTYFANRNNLGFEVLTAVFMNSPILWDITPCRR